MNLTIKEELQSMGFKGMLLQNLLQIITDNEMLNTFYNFILENEEQKMTRVLLVHKFGEFMQNKHSYADSDEFASAYETAETLKEKEEVVEKLMAESINPEILKKVVNVFDEYSDNLPKFYERISKWRNMHKPHEIVALLELLI